MADTRLPLLNALYARLNGNVGSGVGVYSSVPDDQQPPVVIIDQLLSEELGSKDASLELYTVEIVTIVAGKSRAALYPIMAAVRTRLENVTLVATGLVLSSLTFLGADEQEIGEEGQAQIGRSRFQVYAQAA